MSWDCKYKIGKDDCRKRNGRCNPGMKGCVLYGKYVFPFKEIDDPIESPGSRSEKDAAADDEHGVFGKG